MSADSSMHPLWPRAEACSPQIWRAVCGYELNPALREELFQDVLLAVWEALPKLRDPERLLPYVLRIAHNLGANHVQGATRQPRALPFDDEHHHANVVEDDPKTEARRRWLFQALSTLPLVQRQPLMLQLEGFGYEEIADMLGISAENVGVRIHRAKTRLKALSSQEQNHGP